MEPYPELATQNLAFYTHLNQMELYPKLASQNLLHLPWSDGALPRNCNSIFFAFYTHLNQMQLYQEIATQFFCILHPPWLALLKHQRTLLGPQKEPSHITFALVTDLGETQRLVSWSLTCTTVLLFPGFCCSQRKHKNTRVSTEIDFRFQLFGGIPAWELAICACWCHKFCCMGCCWGM